VISAFPLSFSPFVQIFILSISYELAETPRYPLESKVDIEQGKNFASASSAKSTAEIEQEILSLLLSTPVYSFSSPEAISLNSNKAQMLKDFTFFIHGYPPEVIPCSFENSFCFFYSVTF
jgi:hypothetical protein